MTDDDLPDPDLHSRWESLLAELDIQSVPVHLLSSITMTMVDGSAKIFEISDLLSQGLSSGEIEDMLEEFIDEHDDEIDTLDFHLNLEALSEEVSTRTRKLLG